MGRKSNLGPYLDLVCDAFKNGGPEKFKKLLLAKGGLIGIGLVAISFGLFKGGQKLLSILRPKITQKKKSPRIFQRGDKTKPRLTEPSQVSDSKRWFRTRSR